MRKLKIILLTALISVGGVSLADTPPTYDRSEWKYWRDVDRDCEDTREEALVRDASYIFYTNKNCTPVLGIWTDPYTDEYFFFASDLDADHIVPLKWAHNHGAWQWPESLKKEFANDLDNVIMVSASANRSKGPRGPSDYMPPNASYQCTYVNKWMEILAKYHLVPSQTEFEDMKDILKEC